VNDYALVLLAKQGCSASFETLLERHSRLYYRTCGRYTKVLADLGISRDDILDDKNIVFYNCILSFNVDKKVKFSTWLSNTARFHCLNTINSRKKITPAVDDENHSEITDDTSEEKNEILEGFDYAMHILKTIKDKRVKKIFELRYLSEGRKYGTWGGIAKQMKISSQTAINLHNRGLKILHKKFSSRLYPDSL
jgi:RNA polymerase sigma factor (sigma-70 family)